MAVLKIKKLLFNGMSEKNAKAKLKEILATKTPPIDLTRVNKGMEAEFGISLLALCEMWHTLRSKNGSVDAMIQAFAGTIAHKNELNNKLSATIHNQRLELEKRLKEIDGLKAKVRGDGGTADASA